MIYRFSESTMHLKILLVTFIIGLGLIILCSISEVPGSYSNEIEFIPDDNNIVEFFDPNKTHRILLEDTSREKYITRVNIRNKSNRKIRVKIKAKFCKYIGNIKHDAGYACSYVIELNPNETKSKIEIEKIVPFEHPGGIPDATFSILIEKDPNKEITTSTTSKDCNNGNSQSIWDKLVKRVSRWVAILLTSIWDKLVKRAYRWIAILVILGGLGYVCLIIIPPIYKSYKKKKLIILYQKAGNDYKQGQKRR